MAAMSHPVTLMKQSPFTGTGQTALLRSKLRGGSVKGHDPLLPLPPARNNPLR